MNTDLRHTWLTTTTPRSIAGQYLPELSVYLRRLVSDISGIVFIVLALSISGSGPSTAVNGVLDSTIGRYAADIALVFFPATLC